MPELHAALLKHFKYPAFRPGQEESLRHVLAGGDALVVMPTGSGKSLIYQLAALMLPGTALVFSPLIALMKDQVDSMVKRGIAATYINSQLDPAEANRRIQGVRSLIHYGFPSENPHPAQRNCTGDHRACPQSERLPWLHHLTGSLSSPPAAGPRTRRRG